MKVKQRFINGIDILLIFGIALFSLGGVAYAIFSGVINLPGVTPFLQADTLASSEGQLDTSTDDKTSVIRSVDEPSLGSIAGLPEEATGAEKEVPAETSQDSKQTELKARDAKRKEDLATLQVALQQYFNKYKKYPITNSGQGKFEKTSIALKVIVDTGFIATLPADPLAEQFYAYTSEGKSYQLTAQLEDSSDPSGANNQENPPKYLYQVNNPK